MDKQPTKRASIDDVVYGQFLNLPFYTAAGLWMYGTATGIDALGKADLTPEQVSFAYATFPMYFSAIPAGVIGLRVGYTKLGEWFLKEFNGRFLL
jgi:hypothetical protein